MNVKRILITNDDGYNSIGTRLLVHFLKNDFDLTIAGTKDQQSGVGGKLNLSGGKWRETEMDGIPALMVDGSPADAMEVSQAYFSRSFDLVLSGINMGANIGTSLISSGTFSAAFRALGIGLSRSAIVLSWNNWIRHSLENHSGDEDLEEYLDYPGSAAYTIIRECLKNDLWKAALLNINFPKEKSNRVRFTKPLFDIRQFFTYPMSVDKRTHSFSYRTFTTKHPNMDPAVDTGALLNGFISLTPCNTSMVDQKIYDKVKSIAFRI